MGASPENASITEQDKLSSCRPGLETALDLEKSVSMLGFKNFVLERRGAAPNSVSKPIKVPRVPYTLMK